MGATEAAPAYKNDGRAFYISAVVYGSIGYQNGIKNPSRVPKTLDI